MGRKSKSRKKNFQSSYSPAGTGFSSLAALKQNTMVDTPKREKIKTELGAYNRDYVEGPTGTILNAKSKLMAFTGNLQEKFRKTVKKKAAAGGNIVEKVKVGTQTIFGRLAKPMLHKQSLSVKMQPWMILMGIVTLVCGMSFGTFYFFASDLQKMFKQTSAQVTGAIDQSTDKAVKQYENWFAKKDVKHPGGTLKIQSFSSQNKSAAKVEKRSVKSGKAKAKVTKSSTKSKGPKAKGAKKSKTSAKKSGKNAKSSKKR
jgi:hypothetical protein